MWHKIAGCAVAAAICVSPAWADTKARRAVPEQKQTRPAIVNTRGEVEAPRVRRPGATSEAQSQHTLTQKSTSRLPNYLNRKGELALVGPTGILEETRALRVDLRPDTSKLVSIRMTW